MFVSKYSFRNSNYLNVFKLIFNFYFIFQNRTQLKMLLGILLLIPSFTTGQVSKYSAYRDVENGRHLPAYSADEASSSYKEQQRSPRASGNLPEDLVSGKNFLIIQSFLSAFVPYVCISI